MSRIESALNSLLVNSKGEINSRIENVCFGLNIPNTQAKGYCYFLKSDGNGNLRLKDLIEYIDTKLVEYAIPKKEIDAAAKYLAETNSPSKILQLRKKASALFTDLAKTGEGGEILLYILIQEFLKFPQLISKMSLKTSGQVHYHGADGVHVSYDTHTDSLNLYWGEAKMYADVSDGIRECFNSLSKYLIDSQSYKSVQERDLQLITAHLAENVNNPELEDLLVRYFDKDDDLSNKLIYKGICFIGFDSDKYPLQPMTKTMEEIKLEISNQITHWHSKLCTQITNNDLQLKDIHVFLMPFPSVSDFRDYYLEEIK